MKRVVVGVVALFALMGSGLRAQDVTGTWQTTVKAGARDLRLVLKVAKDGGQWNVVTYSIDQGAAPINASSASLEGTTFKFALDVVGGSYEGKLSADGNTITGTWAQSNNPLPMVLVRATPETAWEIPAPKAPPVAQLPPKMMDPDAVPSFQAVTIKPSQSTETTLQGLTLNGHAFLMRSGSLIDLIGFAYLVKSNQIVGGPDWIDSTRYDIDALPDLDGIPSQPQLRMMVQKLLAEHFKLTFHHEKRELSAYVLTVGKDGEKLAATQMTGPLPGLGFRPGPDGLTLGAGNATMADLTNLLQMVVLDRPVVDRTGLVARFDFKFTFTPDSSQFSGHPPKVPVADGAASAPNLFDAIQQQLGLKLTAEKTAVDVIAIDHVEKHSEN